MPLLLFSDKFFGFIRAGGHRQHGCDGARALFFVQLPHRRQRVDHAAGHYRTETAQHPARTHSGDSRRAGRAASRLDVVDAKIETGGGEGAEASLSVLSRAEVEDCGGPCSNARRRSGWKPERERSKARSPPRRSASSFGARVERPGPDRTDHESPYFGAGAGRSALELRRRLSAGQLL